MTEKVTGSTFEFKRGEYMESLDMVYWVLQQFCFADFRCLRKLRSAPASLALFEGSRRYLNTG